MRKLCLSIAFLFSLLTVSNSHATVAEDFKTSFYGGFFLGGFSPENNLKQLSVTDGFSVGVKTSDTLERLTNSLSGIRKLFAADYKTPFHIGLFMGHFSPKESPQLRKIGGSFVLGINAGYYLNNYLSLESDFSILDWRFERKSGTTIPGAANNENQLQTYGLSIGAKVGYPIWKLRPFVGGGVGGYSTSLGTRHPQEGRGGFTQFVGPSPPDETSLGYYFLSGIGAKVTPHISIDFVWKRTVFNANFQEFTDGKVELGNDSIYLLFRIWGY